MAAVAAENLASPGHLYDHNRRQPNKQPPAMSSSAIPGIGNAVGAFAVRHKPGNTAPTIKPLCGL